MSKSLIFTAVGIPVAFHPEAYKPEDHWRYKNPDRNYETVVYQYNDFEIEDGTYDYLSLERTKGYKWQIARKFLSEFDYSDYEYIAFFDDDLITDYQSINRAIELAKENNCKIFQLSTLPGSESSHRILHQDNNLKYTTTNFIEGMGPFFHVSLIPILLDFWKLHDVKSGYGFDVLFTKITKENAMVIHEKTMYHPPAEFKEYVPSYYNKDEANKEMNHIFSNVYPHFMMQKYSEYVTPIYGIEYRIYNMVLK